MIKFDDIQKANETILTVGITKTDKKTGETVIKQYAEVNQRVKAFRMVYPTGFITSEILSNDNGVCLIRATAGYADDSGATHILGIGTACEKENSSFINQSSHVENCETSAVGRALGFAGFGIDTSIASKEEVENAMLNQAPRATQKQIEILKTAYVGDNLKKLLEINNIFRIEDLPLGKASELIEKLKAKKENNNE